MFGNYDKSAWPLSLKLSILLSLSNLTIALLIMQGKVLGEKLNAYLQAEDSWIVYVLVFGLLQLGLAYPLMFWFREEYAKRNRQMILAEFLRHRIFRYSLLLIGTSGTLVYSIVHTLPESEVIIQVVISSIGALFFTLLFFSFALSAFPSKGSVEFLGGYAIFLSTGWIIGITFYEYSPIIEAYVDWNPFGGLWFRVLEGLRSFNS